MHLGPQPVARVAIDLDPSTSHLAADMPSRVTMDVDRASTHAVADVMDARQVPLEIDLAVRGIARDGEQLGQR